MHAHSRVTTISRLCAQTAAVVCVWLPGSKEGTELVGLIVMSTFMSTNLKHQIIHVCCMLLCNVV